MVERTPIWNISKGLAGLHFEDRARGYLFVLFSIWHTLPYSSSVATNPREVGELTLSIANEVKIQRTAAELTQGQLADQAQIAGSTLSKIERGLMAIDTEQIDRLAAAFKMKPEDFVASARQRTRRNEEFHAAVAREKKARLRKDRELQHDPDYRPDGTLDPDAVRGAVEPDDHLAEAAAHRKERSAGRRTSTPAT